MVDPADERKEVNGEKNETNLEEEIEIIEPEKTMQDQKLSWAKLRRVDLLHLEAGRVSNGWMNHTTKSIGVVYGNIGTSPLYVYASTFSDGIQNNNDKLGVLSLIILLLLSPLLRSVSNGRR
ncbi:PREDICTED: potassium transporter 5-like [Nelumbo nucifera]|uniref:Potassium transporter 5-like n=1 Tax=Nelumbo nucifera TaxID=4432 RepID=A0A1U8ALY7_NELNU|nr:PREDICTED: potassium transporter 5-like [Nelumbo nucifera]